MKGTLILTKRYMIFHWGKSLVLLVSLSIILLLPITVTLLVRHYNKAIRVRAQNTPLIIGAKGNRYDLVLKSLYFSTEYDKSISMADVDFLRVQRYGIPIPLHVRYTARMLASGENSVPIVGTEKSYFKFRKLSVEKGTLPLLIGDAVVGAEFAQKTGCTVGDHVVSDPKLYYDQARTFQLKMPVKGVLRRTGTPDDNAVFVDINTAWVIDGIGHGHNDQAHVNDSARIGKLQSADSNVVHMLKTVKYQEITDENRASFHFHGPREDFPVTSCILVPKNNKMHTIALGKYAVSATREALVPEKVIDELMGFVFRIKRFFDANFLIVITSMLCLTALVFTLSYRLRRKEFEILNKIGCSQGTIVSLIIWEIVLIIGISLSAALIGAVGLVRITPFLLQTKLFL